MTLEETLTKMIPGIMDERMLAIGCKHGSILSTESDKMGAGAVLKRDGVNWETVESLELEFQSILLISNLWRFKNLRTLNLSNNHIEEISGLESLRCLQKLDLSYNSITRIQGLETLTNLENLSLFQNCIEVLRNLDQLTKLKVFSFGNNKLSSLASVLYLRQFSNLRSLTLKGNPISSLPNYDSYVISHLEQLKFFDYRYIENAEREEAVENNRIAVETLANEEKRHHEAARKVQEQEEVHSRKKAAFVESLVLPESLLSYLGVPFMSGNMQLTHVDDFVHSSGEKLGKVFFSFWESGQKTLGRMCEAGLAKHEERRAELESIRKCIKKLDAESQEESMRLLDAFTHDLKENLKDVQGIIATLDAVKMEQNLTKKKPGEDTQSEDEHISIMADPKRLSDLVNQVLALSLSSCQDLRKSLLGVELQAKETTSDAINSFKEKLGKYGLILMEQIQEEFKTLETLSEECEKAARLAAAEQDEPAGNEEESGVGNLPLMCDLVVAEQNRSAAMDKFAQKIEKWELDACDELVRDADARHRKRIAEIIRTVEAQEKRVHVLKAEFEEKTRPKSISNSDIRHHRTSSSRNASRSGSRHR